VTVVHKYEDLHDLVDHLTPEGARELRTHALRLVGKQDDSAVTQVRSTPRDLSYIGIIHAESDLAERSEEILREEFGH
jgi:hypothetical protein